MGEGGKASLEEEALKLDLEGKGAEERYSSQGDCKSKGSEVENT